MALDIEAWDERIIEDYKHIQAKFHKKWAENRDIMNNEGSGSRFGNLTKEFSSAVRARLINKNFFVKVSADDPDYTRNAQEMTIMANSVSRSVGLKEVLDNATEDSLWAGTGWIEVGHSTDLHSFDAMRTILHKNSNAFNPNEIRDQYEPVSEEEVGRNLGVDIENVTPFNPFEQPEISAEADEPRLTFDPELGSPWVKTILPFFIVLPKETKHVRDADYVTKLVLLSREELELITDTDIPDNITLETALFQQLVDETPGGEYIETPIVVAVTYIRRDRNDPRYTGWYFAHVIGHTDIVIKSAPNPYGGMIPLIPAKSRSSMKILSKSWIEDLRPYTDNQAKVLEAMFKKIRASLAIKWSVGANGSVDKTNSMRINNPNYNGEVKFEAGSPESFQYMDGPGLSQDDIQAINLLSKLAQGEAGQTDIDRGTPVKKITARQTEALLQTSELMMHAIRGPIVDAGNEAILKLIHLLNLFSSPRGHIYSFGPHVVEIEPGGNDFTTSYQYKIEVKDLEGPANAETQLLFVQFLNRVAALPQFQSIVNWAELFNEGRRAFGMGIEVMAQLQPPGITGETNNAGSPPGMMLPSGGAGGQEARLLGDQGSPDTGNALAGLFEGGY